MRLVYIVLLMMVSISAYAGGIHHHTVIQGEQGIQGERGLTGANGLNGKDGVNASTLYKGVAAALASSQHNFGFYTPKTQWSIAGGQFDNESALSIGLGKRLGDVLINGSVVNESGEIGFGIGLSGRF